MSTQSSQQAARGSSFRWRASHPGPDLRVSDAERSEIADQLSKHYSDGRLDQAEFSERLDRAMSAKTQSDLAGLLTDLPGGGPPAKHQRPHPRRGHLGRFVLLVVAVVVAAAVGQALLRSYLVLVVIAALVFLWLRFGARSRR
jgi:Flp pilus assembly protein TadB